MIERGKSNELKLLSREGDPQVGLSELPNMSLHCQHILNIGEDVWCDVHEREGAFVVQPLLPTQLSPPAVCRCHTPPWEHLTRATVAARRSRL
jgi:hypothetical protein